jgi:transcriptional regulator with XRE-family HTH domain
MTFGEKLRQLRKRKKLTQEQMAELIEIHESHVGRYEKDFSSPTAQVLIRIAKLFNVSTDYLLFDDQNDTSTTLKISDNELFAQFQEVDKMSEEKRELIKRIIAMAINEDKIKKMVS